MNTCKKCEEEAANTMSGQAFTPYKCIGCGKECSHHNTDTPKYCVDCSMQKGVCIRCSGSLAMPVVNENIVVWDLETTGFYAPDAKVIEIGAISIIDGIKEEHRWVLNHNIDIPEKITQINGFTREMIEAEGRDPGECFSEFLDVLRLTRKHVTHNGIKFDIPFLTISLQHGMMWDSDKTNKTLEWLRKHAYDTAVKVKADKLRMRQHEGESFAEFGNRVMNVRAMGVKFNLTQSCEEAGIDTFEITAHRALGDCQMTHLLYQKQHEKS